MRRFILLSLFLPCAAAAAVSSPAAPPAHEPTGVFEVPFGMEREKALHFLVEKHNMQMYGTPNEYFGNNYFNLRVSEGFLVVPDHCIEGTCYDVYLMFGKAGRFYSYFYKTQGVTANNFDTTLQSDALTLSLMLQEKFGPPSEKFKPGFFDVKQGYDVFFWRWSNPDFNIFTALNVTDSKFFALAKVTHRQFEAEERAFAPKQKRTGAK